MRKIKFISILLMPSMLSAASDLWTCLRKRASSFILLGLQSFLFFTRSRGNGSFHRLQHNCRIAHTDGGADS